MNFKDVTGSICNSYEYLLKESVEVKIHKSPSLHLILQANDVK